MAERVAATIKAIYEALYGHGATPRTDEEVDALQAVLDAQEDVIYVAPTGSGKARVIANGLGSEHTRAVRFLPRPGSGTAVGHDGLVVANSRRDIVAAQWRPEPQGFVFSAHCVHRGHQRQTTARLPRAAPRGEQARPDRHRRGPSLGRRGVIPPQDGPRRGPAATRRATGAPQCHAATSGRGGLEYSAGPVAKRTPIPGPDHPDQRSRT